MHDRDGNQPIRATQTSQFGEKTVDVRDMIEHQTTEDPIKASVREWQRAG